MTELIIGAIAGIIIFAVGAIFGFILGRISDEQDEPLDGKREEG